MRKTGKLQSMPGLRCVDLWIVVAGFQAKNENGSFLFKPKFLSGKPMFIWQSGFFHFNLQLLKSQI
jgi:hypothetical protein